MPLPLPQLDTRRWSDLVDEGRALIPRYAPQWTDHNVHDPGITLIELLAWLVEQDIYRLNRIPERHRRKFLALAGFLPHPPRPAQVALTFTLTQKAGPQKIPAGLTVTAEKNSLSAAGNDSGELRFRTLTQLMVVPAQITTVQVFDGTHPPIDQTRRWCDGLPFPLLGTNPQTTSATEPDQQPAFYLGFDQTFPSNKKVANMKVFTLWFWLASGRSDQAERDRISSEAQQATEACQPYLPPINCQPAPLPSTPWCQPDQASGGKTSTNNARAGEPETRWQHHAVRLAWDYYDGHAWRQLDPEKGEVEDTTRGLTLDGPVQFTLPGDMKKFSTSGPLRKDQFYLRCRLTAGRPDVAPLLKDVALNTVAAEQTSPAYQTFTIAPGVIPEKNERPVPSVRQKLWLALNEDSVITQLKAGPELEGSEAFVFDYQPATATTAGALTTALVWVGHGSGWPNQQIVLPGAPIAHGRVQLWTITSEESQSGPNAPQVKIEPWQQRPDLDASKRSEANFMLDPTSGAVTFGDGEHGRVVPAGAPILAAYEQTTGAAGNIAAGAKWRLAEADDTLNRFQLKQTSLAQLKNALGAITNRRPAAGGADEETLSEAAGRAVEALWAHERLLDLCPAGQCRSLDQLDRPTVLARTAPARATTLLDFERLALDVPGVWVRRAKAWAGLDPDYPCFKAPGTVTVVIVPELPARRPAATPGLLRTVQRYLERRRVLGTRLVVIGPKYLEVRVKATVRVRPGAEPARIQPAIVAQLDAFLDPLHGGPAGRGWPFGRDVYRAEILQVIDNVPGVDHVLGLELTPGQGEAQCGNLCVGPTWLVTPGKHGIEVTGSSEVETRGETRC